MQACVQNAYILPGYIDQKDLSYETAQAYQSKVVCPATWGSWLCCLAGCNLLLLDCQSVMQAQVWSTRLCKLPRMHAAWCNHGCVLFSLHVATQRKAKQETPVTCFTLSLYEPRWLLVLTCTYSSRVLVVTFSLFMTFFSGWRTYHDKNTSSWKVHSISLSPAVMCCRWEWVKARCWTKSCMRRKFGDACSPLISNSTLQSSLHTCVCESRKSGTLCGCQSA